MYHITDDKGEGEGVGMSGWIPHDPTQADTGLVESDTPGHFRVDGYPDVEMVPYFEIDEWFTCYPLFGG